MPQAIIEILGLKRRFKKCRPKDTLLLEGTYLECFDQKTAFFRFFFGALSLLKISIFCTFENFGAKNGHRAIVPKGYPLGGEGVHSPIRKSAAAR